MWEELEKYRNHYLQREIKDLMKPSAINSQQNKVWTTCMGERNRCKAYASRCNSSSTYLQDRAQLAYGWSALPKLMHEMDSDVSLTHWCAIVSLTDFLINPLNAQRAILEMDIVRKVKNAFMRMRRKCKTEEFKEMDTYMRIFNILSRNLDGAERIAQRKCLMTEFYKILQKREPSREDLAAEILRNLTAKPKVLDIVLADDENFVAVANIFKRDPCQPLQPPHLWHHLCHMLELAPERGIELGFFELLHRRIAQRLAMFWHLNSKAFALLLRCAEGQRRFDEADGVQLIYDVFEDMYQRKSAKLPLQHVEDYEYIVLILLNGLHSKRALWRSREFTTLACHVARRMCRDKNPRLQLYCLKTLRQLCTMPCIKRFLLGNWLQQIRQLDCLDADVECARDDLLDWLRRDVAVSSS